MPEFRAGHNIALKIPRYRFEATVHFYRYVLRLPYVGAEGTSHVFRFGSLQLWLDCVENYAQSDMWLELCTNSPAAEACQYLAAQGVSVRPELKPLHDLDAQWISDPAGTVLLVSGGIENTPDR